MIGAPMVNSSVQHLRLMIVAGEASGDALAAKLVRALREQAPGMQFEFFGATGNEMRRAGVLSVVHADQLSITGLAEVAHALPNFWAAYKRLKQAALAQQPDAVILVDWPDFNLRLARALHRRGLKIIYYVSPQLWAWRSYRARNIRRDIDLLLAVLPFDPHWYEKRGIHHVEFIGHPLVGEVRPRYGRQAFCERHNLDPQRPLVALLPGSRRHELRRILPAMIEAAALLASARLPAAQFVIALAPNRAPDEVMSLLEKLSRNNVSQPTSLCITQGETVEALAAADAAAVASGTATLEAALLATPLVVVYKESTFNWHTLGRLINTEHHCLVNLVAGERLATELMQDDFTAARLAEELMKLLDPENNKAARARLRQETAGLGASGASVRAADAIQHALEGWSLR